MTKTLRQYLEDKLCVDASDSPIAAKLAGDKGRQISEAFSVSLTKGTNSSDIIDTAIDYFMHNINYTPIATVVDGGIVFWDDKSNAAKHFFLKQDGDKVCLCVTATTRQLYNSY